MQKSRNFEEKMLSFSQSKKDDEAMEKLQTIQEVTTFVRENHLVFLYVSQEDCSVCHVLQPKLTELLKKYPEIELREVEAHKVKEISAEYLIFSAPTMLFFVDGKEYIREGKFVQFKKLDAQIEHIYSHTKDSA